MTFWHVVIQHILPFEWAQPMFMKNALLAILLLTPIFGLLGTMVVNWRMAFFSDAIGHSALTGIAIGVIFGFADPLWAMIIFAVVLAIAISLVRNLTNAATDTIIGVFSAAAVALGIVILSQGGGFAKYSRFLIGDFLSISPREVGLLALVFCGVLIFWIVIYNRLLLVSISPSLARSRGINIQKMEIVFTVVMAVIVTVSIQWVGILIINSLLVIPAAAARNIANDVRQYHIVSVLITLLAGITGLIGSYYWGTATGATIVLFAVFIYLLTLFCRFRFG
ncbi:MAG: metal ABC transporter permease [Heliobacteriaceae bacterium]|nr:metal ABC transporter permease [Heliobacteriaceae bacterium]MDD4587325.1 metal ABC transporter permease [Heliobacteriaceae bacterium]